MSEPTEDKSVRPWHWPRIWWHDEKFWREVATRTLAALIAALIVFLGAVGAGYIQQPAGRSFFGFVLTIGLVPLFLAVVVKTVAVYYNYQKRSGKKEIRLGLPWYLAIPATILILGLFGGLMVLIQLWVQGGS